MQLLRHTAEPKSYLRGMVRTARQGGYLTVGEHTTGGYLSDNVIDSFNKLFPLVCFCILHYTLFIIFYLYTIHYTLYIMYDCFDEIVFPVLYLLYLLFQ